MEIRSLHANEREAALALIWETFLRFEAPDYVPEGVRAFRAFIDAPEQIDALEFFGAFQEGELLGVLATSERRKHICCFFVAAAHQRRGIGRKLWEHLLANSKNDLFTVHSSPYAVPVYHKLGFVDTDAERVEDGIRYTPMKYTRQRSGGDKNDAIHMRFRLLYGLPAENRLRRLP